MSGKLIHVGFGNYVDAGRVRSVENPHSAPIQRIVREARKGRTAIDMTAGRRTKTVLFLDTGSLALLAIGARSYKNRAGRTGD